MLKIISELKMVKASHSTAVGGGASAKDHLALQHRSTHISFDDLSRTMEEFDVVLRRPAFIEEKQL